MKNLWSCEKCDNNLIRYIISEKMNESEEKKDMKNKKFNALELDDFDEKLPYKSSVY